MYNAPLTITMGIIHHLLVLLFIFAYKGHCEDGLHPVSMSHRSYHVFDTPLEFEPEFESRSKRALPKAVAFTVQQADMVVQLHNQFRGRVKPEAANMEYMKWDPELARMAMRFSERCVWGHGHVVNVSPYSSVGQNLWIQGLSKSTNVPTPTSAINAWFNEARHYNFDKHECNSPYQCGHYTQLVWAETTAVGCGMTFCPRTGGNWTHANSWIMTCYYGPAGNYIGVRPYVRGPSCTQCKSEIGQCYNNMCRLCNEHKERCECRQQCVNCGTVDPMSCTCICQDGWYGPDCSKMCNETHPWCNKSPGWPTSQYCGQHPMIPKHCPKMCGLCVDRDPLFVCNPSPPTDVAPVAPGAGRPGATLAPNRPNPGLPNPPVTRQPARTLKPLRPVFPTTARVPVNPPFNPNNPNTPFNPNNPNTPVNPPYNPYPPIVPGVPGNPNPPLRPTSFPPVRPTAPRYPYPGPTAVDCKIPCQNGGKQDIGTCRCTCPPEFTGQYCQHDLVQIQNGAMLRLVGDIRNWGQMEYDMHTAIEQSVDIFCNKNVALCCPGTPAAAPTVQKNYLEIMNVMTGTGFPEVDAFNKTSYWILLVATKPDAPQLCIDSAAAGAGGAAVSPALLLERKRHKRYASASSEEDMGGGAGGGLPVQYVEQAVMLNSVDQNMGAIQQVLMMYNVKLAEVQRPRLQKSAATTPKASFTLLGMLLMVLLNSLFV